MTIWQRILVWFYTLVGGRRCSACEQRPLHVDGCVAADDRDLVPFPGWDALLASVGAPPEPRDDERCRCGALPGHFHHVICDLEECGRCGGQAISCQCDFEAP